MSGLLVSEGSPVPGAKQLGLASLVSVDLVRVAVAGSADVEVVAGAGVGPDDVVVHAVVKFNPASTVDLALDDSRGSYTGSIFNLIRAPGGALPKDEVVANFEEIKHQLTKIYKQEAYAQSYTPFAGQEGLSAIVIKPLLHRGSSDVKINCHYSAYTEQGLGVLQGAYDLLRIRMFGRFEELGFSGVCSFLEEHFKEFLVDMKRLDAGMSDEVRAESGHKQFNQRLAFFNDQILKVLNSNIPSETLKKDLEQARLWAPLAFEPKSYVVQDPDGDVTVREPVIVAPGEALGMKLDGSLKNQLFAYHKSSLRAGRLIPTQLTDQSIKIDGIGPRNAWLVTSFQEDAAKAGRPLTQVSQVTTSGVFSFNSAKRAGDIFQKETNELVSMTGDPLKTMVPATLTTDANIRDLKKMSKSTGNEKTAHDVYVAMSSSASGSTGSDSDSSGSGSALPVGGAGAAAPPLAAHRGFKFMSSPLFMRMMGTVEDQSTVEVIDSLFSVGGPLRSEERVSALKGFLDLDSSERATDMAAAARKQIDALSEIRAERDPKKKRLMHALLTWKMLDFNQNHKGSEPFKLVLDQFESEMGGERPIYHIWQLALSAMIHEGAHSLLNIQCKSGKDRTGMALACHQILNKTYDAEYGFLGRSSLSAPNDGKDRFIAARDMVMRRGDIQLAASEGGTQGCFGVMDNGEVRGVFARIFGIHKDDPRSGVLVSKQGNGRKDIRTSDVLVASEEEQVKVLLGVFRQATNDQRLDYLKRNENNLQQVFGPLSGLRKVFGTTDVMKCSEALTVLFQLSAKKGGLLAQPAYRKINNEAETVFEKALSGLDVALAERYRSKFQTGLLNLRSSGSGPAGHA